MGGNPGVFRQSGSKIKCKTLPKSSWDSFHSSNLLSDFKKWPNTGTEFPGSGFFLDQPADSELKGIVQPQLGWAQTGVNLQVLLERWTFFFTLKGQHLGFCRKRFAATWAQIIGNFRKNWWSAANSLWSAAHFLAPMELAPECASHHGMALEPFRAK